MNDHLAARVGRVIQQRNLFEPGQSILVAVSGGLDSMALFHLLHRLAPKAGWKLAAAHFNHQLRGDDSDADETFARRQTGQLALPCFVGRGDVRRHARENKLSIEMAARQLRHAFLAVTARTQGIPSIALAHHADDQVELFLLRLLRGAGGEGLSGMKWRSPSPADSAITLVRPLLDSTRSDLEEFVRAENIPFSQDASNTTLDFQRNRLRNHLLPLLRREYQPALDSSIRRVMDLIGAENDFCRKTARAFRIAPSPRAFERLHPAVQRQVIILELLELGIPPEFDCIEQLRGAPHKPVTVRPKVRVWRDLEGKLHLERLSAAEFQPDRISIDLAGESGAVEFAHLKIRWSKVPISSTFPMPPHPPAGTEYFDAASIGPAIQLRHWHPGDRFQPIGMPVPVKLQDLFTNLKLPLEHRRHLVVAATAQHDIFWVEQLRISELGKLRQESHCALKWEWTRKEALLDRGQTDGPVAV